MFRASLPLHKKSTAPTFISMRRVPTQRAPERKSTLCLLGADCIYCKILKSATWKMKTKTKKFKLMNNFIIKLSFLYPASCYYTVNVMGKKSSHRMAPCKLFLFNRYDICTWSIQHASVEWDLRDCFPIWLSWSIWAAGCGLFVNTPKVVTGSNSSLRSKFLYAYFVVFSPSSASPLRHDTTLKIYLLDSGHKPSQDFQPHSREHHKRHYLPVLLPSPPHTGSWKTHVRPPKHSSASPSKLQPPPAQGSCSISVSTVTSGPTHAPTTPFSPSSALREHHDTSHCLCNVPRTAMLGFSPL